MIKWVIFDFDGTIADTLPIIEEYINNKYAHYADKLTSNDVREKGLKYFIEKVRELGIPAWKIPAIVSEIKKNIKKRLGEDTKVFHNMDKVIKKLSKNYSLGIISSNSTENITAFLKNHKLEKYFKFISSDGSIFGKHLVIKKTCEKYNIPLDEMIYVGDEERDVEATKKINVKIISVSWGFNSRKLLEKEKPDYLIDSPDEILEILG